MPSVLVTGAGRGIGRAVALNLAASGWEVYAGVRSVAAGDALRADAPAGTTIETVPLEITDPDQVAGIPAAVGGRLDALVNNAGTVMPGPIEAIPLDDLRHQLEVNVTGQVAVAQAVLPMLRTSRGRIAFVSSISGRIATPLLGAYAASKFAVEGLADAMRVELRPWGVKVILIEPGSIDTDIWRKAQDQADEVQEAMSSEHRRLYGAQVAAIRKLAGRVQKQAAPPESVAQTVQTALTASRPRARYVVGKDAHAQLVVVRAMPTRAWDAVLARVSGAA